MELYLYICMYTINHVACEKKSNDSLKRKEIGLSLICLYNESKASKLEPQIYEQVSNVKVDVTF